MRGTIRNGRALLLITLLVLTACSMFQRDPVGSSLIAARNAYESVIAESGNAYKAKAISGDQLKEIVALGRKFHDVYGLAVDAHLLQNEQDAQKYQLQMNAILVQLQQLAGKYFGYGGVK